jgi:ParB family transcriptional regulator, chromosome partitioning protein
MNALQISIDQIDTNPFQLRGKIETSDINELVNSIKDVGVIQPLLVTQVEDRYILIAGHRRLEASIRAKLKEVPCVIQDLPEDVQTRYALIENLQRVDLSPLQEALALKKLLEIGGIDYRKAAELIGKSKTYVGERMLLLRLPDDLRDAVSQGTISMKKADLLRRVKSSKVRGRLLERAPMLDLPTLRALVENTVSKLAQARKTAESWDYNERLMAFAKSNENIRLYKDRVSFKYDSEKSLYDLLCIVREILENDLD